MDRLTEYEIVAGKAYAIPKIHSMNTVVSRLAQYEDMEEQGLLLKLPLDTDKDDLINVLAEQLLKTDWGHCYMCTNPMKNITLDGFNNGCDGECRSDDSFTVDDLISKIVMELKRRKEWTD